MILFENYNTARQKYGIEMVNQLSTLGLPPQYLWSACRFIKEYNVPLQRMVNQFKEWVKYVIKFVQYDVNKLSYDDFLSILSQEKSSFLYHTWGLYSLECTKGEYKGNTIILHVQNKERLLVCTKCGKCHLVKNGYRIRDFVGLPNSGIGEIGAIPPTWRL